MCKESPMMRGFIKTLRQETCNMRRSWKINFIASKVCRAVVFALRHRATVCRQLIMLWSRYVLQPALLTEPWTRGERFSACAVRRSTTRRDFNIASHGGNCGGKTHTYYAGIQVVRTGNLCSHTSKKLQKGMEKTEVYRVTLTTKQGEADYVKENRSSRSGYCIITIIKMWTKESTASQQLVLEQTNVEKIHRKDSLDGE
jgi:hypothetical protein